MTEPMREHKTKKSRIFLSPPHMSGKELKYVHEAFDTNWIAPTGPNVDAFEEELSAFTGAKCVAALSSGTAAIHLALIILGVRTGDYVLCSSFTFAASVNPVIYCGAKPVLIDSESSSWNMDPDLLEEAIYDLLGKSIRPKALIITHLYGMPAQMRPILEICKEHNIPVIEDAAEALGAYYKNKHLGTLGDIGILSFNGNKIITTSGGGAMISNNPAYIEKARFLSTQARDEAPHYQHSEIGYNYRMSNIVAGVGRGQMEVIEERIRSRRELNAFYRRHFEDYPAITFQTEALGQSSNYWLTTIIIDPEKCNGISREKLRIAFENENIETRPLWKPMHLQPVFAKYPKYTNGVSEDLFEKGLCLPSGSNLTDEDLYRIIDALNQCFKG